MLGLILAAFPGNRVTFVTSDFLFFYLRNLETTVRHIQFRCYCISHYRIAPTVQGSGAGTALLGAQSREY